MPAISFPTTPVIGVVSKDQDKLIHKNDFLNPTNLTPTNSSTFLKFYFKGIGSCFASLLVFSTLGISTVINFEIKTPTWIRLFNDVIIFPQRLFMIHGKLPYYGIYAPVYEEILFLNTHGFSVIKRRGSCYLNSFNEGKIFNSMSAVF